MGDIPLISVRDLHKSFSDQKVLQGIDLQISHGESVAIIGQSGCGKSVFLKHLLRLMSPDRGQVLFDGADIAEFDDRELVSMRRRFGMLFQSAALFDSMSVEENVGLGLTEEGELERDEIHDIAIDCLSRVGLDEAAEKMPAELSGGMRKRVGLARAIANKPEVLLYDEPTTGLDPVTAEVINELIQTLNRDLEVTSIVVTHDMHSAAMIAKRFVMFHKGQVIFDGPREQLTEATEPQVREFVKHSLEELR